jgi:hypothetical protein
MYRLNARPFAKRLTWIEEKGISELEDIVVLLMQQRNRGKAP